MVRYLPPVFLIACLAGCAAPCPELLAGFEGVPVRLTLDTSLSGNFLAPAPAIPAVADGAAPCRRESIPGTRMTRRVCDAELARERLRDAERAGLRALRRSELNASGAE